METHVSFFLIKDFSSISESKCFQYSALNLQITLPENITVFSRGPEKCPLFRT
jgi:hypothetical protein